MTVVRPSARPRRRAPLRSLALAALLATLPGCGDSTDPVPACGAFGSGPEITVGAGLTPSITWTPRCLVTAIQVARTGGPAEEMWSVLSDDFDAGFGPGQTYGVTPRGTRVLVAPKPLVAGSTYVVSVYVEGQRVSAVRQFQR